MFSLAGTKLLDAIDGAPEFHVISNRGYDRKINVVKEHALTLFEMLRGATTCAWAVITLLSPTLCEWLLFLNFC